MAKSKRVVTACTLDETGTYHAAYVVTGGTDGTDVLETHAIGIDKRSYDANPDDYRAQYPEVCKAIDNLS